MDVESVTDELYSLSRDEFTAARNAAVKRAREQGDRELAEQIGALRRPSTAAWVANQLVREQPDEVHALVELGDGLREAQRRLQGAELRRLSQERRELVRSLVQQAQALVRTAGHPVSEAVVRELGDTFTAAVNSSAAARALAGGRLTSALDPAEGTVELFAGAGAFDRDERVPDGSAHGAHEATRQRQDLERFRSEATDAATMLDKAQRVLTDADQAAQDAATALQELRCRLDAAERTEHEARRRAESAQRDFEAADRRARQAQRRVHDLERQRAQHQNR